MTIGEASRASGIPASTIRYYEAAGIVPRAPRKQGIRDYDDAAVEELKALRFYRESGIALRGLAAIARQPRGTHARTEVWRTVLASRIEDLEASARAAQRTKRRLTKLLDCRCNGRRDRCVLAEGTVSCL